MMTADYSHWLSTATTIFLSWSFLIFAVRIWVKKSSHQWGHDDSTITVAFVFATAQVTSTYLAISRGYGRVLNSIPGEDIAKVDKALFAGQLLYIITTGLSRCSTALFIRRLTRQDRQVKAASVLAAVAGVWTFISVFVVALRGNLARPWTTLDGQHNLYTRWLAVEIVSMVIEIGLWALCINLVWGLHMALWRRIQTLGIFGCRLLVLPATALRLHFLALSSEVDLNFSNVVASIITQAVMQYSLIAASITCLKAFLRPFHSSYIVSNVKGVVSDSYRSHDPYMLDSVDSKTMPAKPVPAVSAKGEWRALPRYGHAWRLDYGAFTVTVEKGDNKGSLSGSKKSSELLRRDDMVIKQTKTFVINEERIE